MKLSISCDPVIKRMGSVEAAFQVIAASGFQCVDLLLNLLLPIHWPYDVPQPVSQFENMTDEELYAYFLPYKEAGEKYGLAFGQAHAVDPSFTGVPSVDERLLHMHKQAIKICRYLNCKYLIVHPAQCEYDFRRITQQEEWDYNMHLFGELIPYLKEYDVIACLENLYTTHASRYYLSSVCQCPYEANMYIDTLNEMAGEKRFAFCLDTGHSMMVSMKHDRVIQTLGHRLEALHLNDNDGINDSHWIPYDGVIDWDIVCESLKEIGYRNSLNFELYLNYDKEAMPEALNRVAQIGRKFAEKIK